jgi:SAM-dependent methyltransferase
MNTNAYWNAYYRERGGSQVSLPSQFAAFVAGELADRVDYVVDVGCGNGRDALFFARHGLKVIGVDASSEAIDICRREADGLDTGFLCSDVSDPALVDRIRSAADGSDDLLVYARFFLHAIDEAAESALLGLAYDLCRAGSFLALEFRTLRDRDLAKETVAHYRRFIDPLAFLSSALAHGFRLDYFVEGFGYAKYRADDAHVARIVLERT